MQDSARKFKEEVAEAAISLFKRNGYIVCNYDRGWDIEPTDENTQLALELLLHSENW